MSVVGIEEQGVSFYLSPFLVYCSRSLLEVIAWTFQDKGYNPQDGTNFPDISTFLFYSQIHLSRLIFIQYCSVLDT